MKRFLRVTLKTIGVIVAVIGLALATSAVVNVAATTAEAERIENYGHRVPVDGKEMNVVISGAGAETIVLLPGFGTAAPALDFSPLIAELATDYRVVAVEPFGYGLSDGTESARTTENIVTEVHEALQALDIDRYAVMGHSIAGIYALEYTERYRDEVTAFVGIDSSVPGQPGMDEELPIGAMQTAKALGLMRVLSSISDPYAGLDFDETTAEQMKLLSFQNSLSPTYVSEMEHIGPNFAAAAETTFPRDLPVLLFAQADSPDIATWAELHEEQAASVDHGEVIFLDGGHYLHHTLSPEIAVDTSRFLSALHRAPAA
ncbi:MAG TPA: alpha/beta hydrolase [Microterricola sp.]